MRLSMRVWDLPVRLFHAAVSLLLIVAVVTWRTHHLRWHVLTGDALLMLLVWRIVWGVVGSDTARWPAFLVNPLAGLGRRGPDDSYGHATAGGWWVLVMLAVMAVQIGSGLAQAARVHAVAGWALLGAVGLHLVLVALRARGGESPLRLMVSGKKRMPAALRAPRMGSAGLAALVLLCAAGAVVLVLRGMHL